MEERERILLRLRQKQRRLKRAKRKKKRQGKSAGGKVSSARLKKILINPTGTHELTALRARGCRAAKARYLRNPPILTETEERIMASYNSGVPSCIVEETFGLTQKGLRALRLRAGRAEKWRKVVAAIAADPRLIDVPTSQIPGVASEDLATRLVKGYDNARNSAASRLATAGFRIVNPIPIPNSAAPGSQIESTTSPEAGATPSGTTEPTPGGGRSPSCSRDDTGSDTSGGGNP